MIYEKHKLGNEKILHAGRGREYYIPEIGVHVDAFREAKGEKYVYQFHGCYFHGHDCHRGSNNSKRYEETLKIDTEIRKLGYNLIVMWECELFKLKAENTFLFDFLFENNFLLYNDVLKPRDAFFGGRTGNTVKYYDVSTKNEKIHYIDICSLYPSVCKFGKFPVGHPSVLIGDECDEIVGPNLDISKVEGLIKCVILPPRTLYHPVLPVKDHDRLFFPLCRKCLENLDIKECYHENEGDRCFEGTWVADELRMAVSKNYKILKIYEI